MHEICQSGSVGGAKPSLSLPLSCPERSVPYGTALLGWRCPRHFVPGYDRTVPPGQKPFARPGPRIKLELMGLKPGPSGRGYQPIMLHWPFGLPSDLSEPSEELPPCTRRGGAMA
jgi:hypothetical protein